MNEVSQQILKHYQIRKTRKQKLNFRHFIISELSKIMNLFVFGF